MCLLKFDSLPGTDVVSYLAEKPMYTEQMVADITGQILDGLDYIQWRGRVYLNLEPCNVLVSSGRSLGKTCQVKLANFETTQTVAKSGTQIKGTYNFDYAGTIRRIFPSNHNIQKIALSLWFWASDLLFDQF